MAGQFTIKDSGERSSFAGGMVRDASVGKIDYTSIFFGPMLKRWADHLTKGRQKYPDPEPGVPNWTLAQGTEELLHAKQSLLRHVVAYMNGERDEDHAAAIYFNVNLIEYIAEKMDHTAPSIEAPGLHNGERVCGLLTRTETVAQASWLAPCRYPEGHGGPHES
jgi:hypothetical protein